MRIVLSAIKPPVRAVVFLELVRDDERDARVSGVQDVLEELGFVALMPNTMACYEDVAGRDIARALEAVLRKGDGVILGEAGRDGVALSVLGSAEGECQLRVR